MWKKILVVIFLFYLCALLQNSFFTHFNLFGASPNLVFILFFLLVFFAERAGKSYQIIFLAIIAGFFLDVISYTYLGPSIVALIVIGFLLKKVQSLLKNTREAYPFAYFAPLFVIFFLVYDLLLSTYLYFLDPSKTPITFGKETVFAVIYNLLIASALFYIYKKIHRIK